MTKLTHIMACTDLSAPSQQAIDRGGLIAATYQTNLSIVHAMNLQPLNDLQSMMGEYTPVVARQITDHTQSALDALSTDAQQRHGITVENHIVYGQPWKAINEYSQITKTPLLIIGASGEGILRQLVLGGTAIRLVRSMPCPVLVVKRPAHVNYKRILLPIACTPEDVDTIEWAQTVAPQARLIFMHAYEIPFEGRLSVVGVPEEILHSYRKAAMERAQRILEQLVTTAKLQKRNYDIEIRHGNAAQHILAIAHEYDCDLIVMGKNGQGLIEELLLGSVTNCTLTDSERDVLVVPGKR